MKLTSLIGIALLALSVLWIGPLALIWAINTLFALDIDYTWETWAAMLLISVVLSSTARR